MNKKDIYYLTFGMILIFISIYLFTRPAFIPQMDLSESGQIGDTIGGISAPLINLIGAYLVYVSFRTQLQANNIQIQALKDEKHRINTDNAFQKQVSHFDDIKSTLRNLEFIVELQGKYNSDGSTTYFAPLNFKGLNALSEFTDRLVDKRSYWGQKYETYGMLLNYQFMLSSILNLIDNVNKVVKDADDKEYLLKNINLFYESFLKPFAIEMEKRKDISGYSQSSIEALIIEINKKYSPT